MRARTHTKRTFPIAIGAIVVAMLMLAVGAWAYDASQDDRIAPGVTIGGIDVGGQSAEEARSTIRSQVVAPLSRPVMVRFGGESYKLTAKQLNQRADVDGMLDEAVEVSREGGLIARFGRYVGGGEVNRDIEARVSYEEKALNRFVERLAGEIDQEPVNASLAPSGDSLNPIPGEDGVEVRQGRLRELIALEVESPVGGREIRVPVRRTEPELTRADLAQTYPTYITIDRSSFTLRLFKNLKLAKKYTIAVGAAGYDTPAGLYSIQDKQVNPYWYVPDSDWAGDLAGTVVPPGPGNPLQARWMGIHDGAGIHGTNEPESLGSAASHGCIRMLIPEVIELFDLVEVGAPVYIG